MRHWKNEVALKPGERVDDLERNGLFLIQDPDRFCFGMDAVLLTGFAQVRQGERVLDLGTGTGIIPVLLSAKTKGTHFTGIELQHESADMAKRSVEMNGLTDRISIVEGDLREAAAILKGMFFDVITVNPPYMKAEDGLKNPGGEKAIARHELCCTLEDVLSSAAALLQEGGRLFMVHRPFRLAEILASMRRYRIEPKRMRLVYPFLDKEPNMVLIEGRRFGKSGMTVERPLIIYEKQGVYTEEIRLEYGF